MDGTATSTTGKAVSRRALLAGSVGVGGVALLAGCREPGDVAGRQGTDPTAGANLPNHIPFDQIQPDIAPANEYCLPGYLAYPNPPATGVTERPGDGSQTVSAFSQTSISVAPPMAKNVWWQNLNEQLGVTLGMQWVKGTEFLPKVQTLIAGDDLPDVMLLPQLPRLDQVLKSKFTDITEYVSGEAIAEYPMLANYTTLSWKNTVFDGSIYGISRPAVPITPRLEARTDVLAELGVEPVFSSGEEFLALCREITDRKAGQFAMAQPTSIILKSMFGLPNEWEETDTGFRNEVESPRYIDYLEFVAAMWKEGLFHPESFQSTNRMPMFQQPSFLLYEVGGAGFTRAMPLYRPGAPDLTVKPVVVPLVEGGGNAPQRIVHDGASLFALRKGLDADQVKLILRMLNFNAAPFGTKEYLTVQYGKEGHNYNFDADGQPVATEHGASETFPVTLFPGTLPFNYSPGHNDVVENECAYEAEVSKSVVLDASAGLFSSTAIDKQAGLSRQIAVEVSEIIQGRKPVSEWASVIKDWAAKGGDQMRQEYEAAAAAR